MLMIGSSAPAQVPAPLPERAASAAPVAGDICVSIAHVRGTVVVGSGADAITLAFESGACEPPGVVIYGLAASNTARDATDVVETSD